jgi:hypothetical protein
MNYEDVKVSWNIEAEEADADNSWDSLSEEEKIEWTIKASVHEVLTDVNFAIGNLMKRRLADMGTVYIPYGETVRILYLLAK